MISKRFRMACVLLGGLTVLGFSAAFQTRPAEASEIKYVVNNEAITSFDIQRRAAFLKLSHKKANAGDEMVEQVLRMQEAKRLGIKIPDATVDAAYAKFAGSNKLTAAQMNTILDKAGVTPQHFKEFIRAQISWGQALSARMRSQGGALSEQDAVQKMLQNGGTKPTATEYMLQQVIFVVPPADRKTDLGKRHKEAEAMRLRFAGCDSTRQFAKGLIDVTVRDLGRLLAPELPKDWADMIKATKAGAATGVRDTDKGVEFIGVCSSKEVSDDRVAKMVFQSQGSPDQQTDDLSKKYLEELRKRARIIER